jgi:uncharacterized protein YbjT (DUF2867 family)
MNERGFSGRVREVLITGGTGYIGRSLVPRLLARNHRVRVLARQSSVARVPSAATPVVGDALDPDSIVGVLRPGDTIIHLVGTPHPSPAKAKQFRQVDLVSIRATVAAVKRIDIFHLIYVSVAQPAPIMRAYLAVRAAGEAMIRDAGLTATIVRPWYVIGPGHRWPSLLMPFYKIAELIPATRESAQRLGLVDLEQMVNTLVAAVEDPPAHGSVRVMDVPRIRRGGL